MKPSKEVVSPVETKEDLFLQHIDKHDLVILHLCVPEPQETLGATFPKPQYNNPL